MDHSLSPAARDAVADAIADAQDTLAAMLATFDRGDADALRYVATKQLPRDLSRVANALDVALNARVSA